MFVLPRWTLCWLREEFGTPGYTKSSSVEVPSVGVLGGRVSGLKILLGEGGDVELGVRTSKHIFVFVFDPLTLNSLSYLCCALFILPYHSYACVVPCIDSYHHIIFACVCVPHLYLTTRASYSTSTLI